MRLIDADALKKCAIPCEIHNGVLTDLCVPLYQIDNAPTIYMEVTTKTSTNIHSTGYIDWQKQQSITIARYGQETDNEKA